jgi:alpha-beta hydrolase superfamily lysophospholipase
MTPPDTIVLIHGFWVTPRSWEHWAERYEARGYKVIAPAYPVSRSRSRRWTRTRRRSRR